VASFEDAQPRMPVSDLLDGSRNVASGAPERLKSV
jgi:hypothetical protein